MSVSHQIQPRVVPVIVDRECSLVGLWRERPTSSRGDQVTEFVELLSSDHVP